MVCHAGRTLASHACRDLVRVRQHSHLAVPPPALVLEALYLVSVSLAGLQDRPEPNSDSSRSLRRSCFPREERLRLRPGPLCTGCHARRPGRGSCSLRGRELDVLQVTNRRLYSFLRRGHPRSTRNVYSGDVPRKKEGLGRLRSTRSALRRELSAEMGLRTSRRGAPGIG